MTLAENSPQSTFPEYFYVISTIKKKNTFTTDRTHFPNRVITTSYKSNVNTALYRN